MKSLLTHIALISLTLNLSAQNFNPTNGTELADNLDSSSRVVVDSFLNSSGRVDVVISNRLSKYSTTQDTKDWVEQQGYLTANAIGQLGYATEEYVSEKVGDVIGDLVNGSLKVNSAENADTSDISFALKDDNSSVMKTAGEIFSALDSIPDSFLTTNDVCFIVTNSDPYAFTAWMFSGLPDGWGITNMEFVLDESAEFMPTEGYSGTWYATFLTNGVPLLVQSDDDSYSWRTWVNFFVSEDPYIYIEATRTRGPLPVLNVAFKSDVESASNNLAQIIAKIGYLTTNDVCAIVTSNVAWYTEWRRNPGWVDSPDTRNQKAVWVDSEQKWYYEYETFEDGIWVFDSFPFQNEQCRPPVNNQYTTNLIVSLYSWFERDFMGQSNVLGLASIDNVEEMVGISIATTDTSYRRTIGLTNLNQSVQYVNIPDTTPTTLEIQLPTDGETKDWMVYVVSVTNVALSLPAATWWMADVAYTNDVPPATPTAFYFSQITTNIFYLGRQELTEVAAP